MNPFQFGIMMYKKYIEAQTKDLYGTGHKSGTSPVAGQGQRHLKDQAWASNLNQSGPEAVASMGEGTREPPLK